MLSGVSVGEDGLLQQFGGIRVYEIVAVGSQHHKVRVFIRMLVVNGLREPLQRQVGGDDANELLVLVEEWYAVGCDHIGARQCSVVVVVEGIYPAWCPFLAGCLIPHLIIIVVLCFTYGAHRVFLRC